MIRIAYTLRVDRPHSWPLTDATLQDVVVGESVAEVAELMAHAMTLAASFADHVISNDNHECGTGLNGAHCAGCGQDWCTVCGHKCSMN